MWKIFACFINLHYITIALHVNQLPIEEADFDYTRRIVESVYHEIVYCLGFKYFTWKQPSVCVGSISVVYFHTHSVALRESLDHVFFFRFFWLLLVFKLKLPTHICDDLTLLNVDNKPIHYSTADSNFYQDKAQFWFVLKEGIQFVLGETRIPIHTEKCPVESGILVYPSVN